MPTILETPRLRLREYTERDLETLAPMVGDEEQMRFYPRPKTKEEASAWISGNLSLYRKHGFGFWFMESVATSEFLGYCGIRPQTVEDLAEIEIGWHTPKKFWNQGVATEAALACRDLAFTRFNLQRLIGIIDPHNAASRRVAEKIGMRPERETVLAECPCVVYALERRSLLET
jgi:ribosomal-protein-alanine N-acetyltransferase